MKTSNIFTWLLLVGMIINGCAAPPEEPVTDVNKMTINNVIVPENFNYATSKNVEILLNAPEMFQGAVFQVQSLYMGKEELTFGKGTFDETGKYTGLFVVNSYVDTIRILSNYIGLVNIVDIPILVGKAGFDYRPLYLPTKSASNDQMNMLKSATAVPFTFLANYNSNGVPSNLITPDTFEKNFFDDINASLPEYKSLPTNHPEFLAGTETNLVLTKQADVWITFVTEGAGWRNALGFYTDPNKELKIIFPNASMGGSGGALSPGSKVYLGRFPANTIIGWFLVANGWNGKQVVPGNGIRYSDPSLNSETNSSLRQHMVLLNDVGRSRILLGFEDMGREDAGCDNDFNDAIFYVTANPIEAVSTSNVSKMKVANDADKDGINDELDDFPFDPNKAFNNFAPSSSSSGTLAFEDLWPSKGDYDFNDLVISYNYNQIANSKNLITSLEATFTIANVGGSYKNGFGFVLPISPDKIKSVENQVMNAKYVSLSSNGTESGQSLSVIFAIENAQNKVGTEIPLKITFNTPVSTSELGGAPYNPFIVVNGNRSAEVHLPDMIPTDLGGSMLGSGDDNSDASKGRYYKTKRNLPWGLSIYGGFSPPGEKVSIDKIYPKFIPWANSGGTINLDWYR